MYNAHLDRDGRGQCTVCGDPISLSLSVYSNLSLMAEIIYFVIFIRKIISVEGETIRRKRGVLKRVNTVDQCNRL